MSDSEFRKLDAMQQKIWDEFDSMPLPRRKSGVVHLRSFLEGRGLVLNADDEDMLKRWADGEVGGDEFAKWFGPLVGQITNRDHLD